MEEYLVDNSKYFFFLCYTSTSEKIEEFLEKSSLNPKDIKDKSNRNALIILAMSSKMEIIKMLIEKYKLNINHKNRNGITSLMAACHSNKGKIVKFLLKKANSYTKW